MPLSKYDIAVDLEHRAGTSHAFVVEMVGSNKAILDVGCDTGYLAEALIAMGCTATGFEINEVTAVEARRRMQRVEVGDLETTNLVEVFGAGQFEVVIFADVLEHLRDPLPILSQARQLLKPGGSVIISTPNVAHGDVRLALLQGRFNYTKVGILDETHTRFFTRDSLVEFVREAGFVVAELRRTIAPLFTTEVGVREEDFPSEVVAALRADRESTTYQFVLRVVPDDATTLDSALALRLDTLQGELAEAQSAVARVTAERDATTAKLTELELGHAVEQEQLKAQIQALQAQILDLESRPQRAGLVRAAAHRARAFLRE